MEKIPLKRRAREVDLRIIATSNTRAERAETSVVSLVNAKVSRVSVISVTASWKSCGIDAREASVQDILRRRCCVEPSGRDMKRMDDGQKLFE